MNEIGKRVRRQREVRGMTQARFAELMSAHGGAWSQSKVWKMEAGQQPLLFPEAIKAAEVLNVSIQWLATGHDDHEDRYLRGYREGVEAARKALEGIAA